jgi:hypothetical protein
MGPPEDCTHQPDRHECAGGRKRAARRPRTRPCLLKGCERPFRPRRARQRYCSHECRQAAREWSRWKAQQRYRATAAGKEKRNGQSRRYRERVRNRKPTTPEEALAEVARVIPQTFFSTTVAIAPAAIRGSPNSDDRPPSGSVRARAGAPCNESGSASGAGAAPYSGSGTGEPPAAADKPDVLIPNQPPA